MAHEVKRRATAPLALTWAVVGAVAWVSGASRARAFDTQDAALALERSAVVESDLLAEAATRHATRLAAHAAAAARLGRLSAQAEALTRDLLLADDLNAEGLGAARLRLAEVRSELEGAQADVDAGAARVAGGWPEWEAHAARWVALEAEAATLRQQARTDEPLDGTWDVRLSPTDDRGTFALRQDGTLLTGRYAQASGRNGSLTGTIVDGKVQLEQVDARLGRHAIFYGVWSSADQTLRGAWESRLLGTGQPGHGTWVAIKRSELPAGTAGAADASDGDEPAGSGGDAQP